MARFLALLFVTFTLSACSSILSESTQDVTFVTPGANDSVCYVDNGDVTYRVWPPQTIKMSKRSADLEVRCLADGNREKTVVIDPGHNSVTLANALNGFIPGVFIDSQTGALYEYPNTVTVDFTEIASQTMPLPNYHKHLMANPDLFGMEEFRPGRSALIRDKYATVPELEKREFPGQAPGYSEFDTGMIEGSGPAAVPPQNTSAADVGNVVAGEKGSDLVSGLTKKMNPEVFGAPAPESSGAGVSSDGDDGSIADTGPVSIYPIEKQ